MNPNAKPPIGQEEQIVISILESTVRHNGHQYEAGTLWKEGYPNLPNNEAAPKARFVSLERRLKKDPALAKAYSEVIREFLRKGFARLLMSEEEANKPICRT